MGSDDVELSWCKEMVVYLDYTYCLFFGIVYLCIPVAGFDALFHL